MSLNTADKVFLIVGLLDFGGLIIWIGVVLHMAYTRMDFLLEFFKNSPGVMDLSHIKHGGPLGRLVVIGSISGYVTFSRFYVQRGCVNAEDVKNLPDSIRRKLVVLQGVGIVLLLVMLGIAAVVKLGLV